MARPWCDTPLVLVWGGGRVRGRLLVPTYILRLV